MLVKDIIDDVKVIYREDDEGLEIENIIFEKILKKVYGYYMVRKTVFMSV